jgi:hypothetical protein
VIPALDIQVEARFCSLSLSYPSGFVDWSKSYLKFTARVKNNGTTAQGKCAFYDNCPFVDRLLVRTGGVVVEDVRNYSAYEKVQLLLRSKSELQGEVMHGNYSALAGQENLTNLANAQEKGAPILRS